MLEKKLQILEAKENRKIKMYTDKSVTTKGGMHIVLSLSFCILPSFLQFKATRHNFFLKSDFQLRFFKNMETKVII